MLLTSDRPAAPAPPFRDLSRLSMILKICLVACFVLASVLVWSEWLQIELLQRVQSGALFDETEAESNDIRQALIALVALPVYLGTVVLFLRWVYLANRNARALGAVGMEFTPGWSVGWNFIPIANLWKPYLAMSEIFRASHPAFRDDWPLAKPPIILPLWWLLTLVSGWIGNFVIRLAWRADTLDELLTSSWVTMISNGLDIPLYIASLLVVMRLQEWQSEKHRSVAAGAEAAVVPAASVYPAF